MFAFLGPAHVCPRGFKTILLTLVSRLSPWKLLEAELVTTRSPSQPLSLSSSASLQLQHASHWAQMETETNSRHKPMLGASAGLLSSLSRRECDTTTLEVPLAASSLVRGVDSDIPIPRKAETGLYPSPPGPHFLLVSLSDEHCSCAAFTQRAALSPGLKALGTNYPGSGSSLHSSLLQVLLL